MPRKKRPEGTRAPNGAGSIYFSESDRKWHGWITVGIKEDGTPDRRHRTGDSEAKVFDKLDELRKQVTKGTLTKPGSRMRVATWLNKWLEIIKPTISYGGYQAYRSAVQVWLIPGIGAHWMDRLEPDHLEKLYGKVLAAGRAPATAHQIHRTARTALGEAHRRGYIGRNVAALAKPPKLIEKETEALEIEDMKRVIETALRRRNGVRYVTALALGLRQGEALGLEWTQLDKKRQQIKRLMTQIQRHTWQHGCADPHACGGRLHKREPCRTPCFRHTRPCPPPCPPDCTNHARNCPQRHSGGLVRVPVKSEAGKRGMGIPDTLFLLLLFHEEAQAVEREAAGPLWEEHGLMFCQLDGRPIDASDDLDEWRSILAEVELPEDRLHAARHSFATLLGELRIPDRGVQGVMGWADASQAKRYQKMNDPVLRMIADRVEGALWDDNRN